jgi:hypothetical protein
MNNTGHKGEKTGYRVILLLVVGLTAFSSAMKELNQVQQLSLEASHLIAQWTEKIAPTEVAPQAVVKLESCEMKQSAPSVELPWLANAADEDTPEPSEAPPAPPVLAHRAKPSVAQLAKLKKLRHLNIDPVQFEVRMSPDHDAEPDEVITAELPLSMFKARARKHGAIRNNPRDREILLKTVNRSINLRIAG